MGIPSRYKQLAGFTILELIIAITIIGFLLGIAVIGVTGAQNRSKKDSATATAQQVKVKLSAYFQSKNRYPANQTDVVTYLGTVNASSIGTTFSNTATYDYTATRADGTTCATTGVLTCDKYTITVKKTWWNGGSSDSDVLITP